MASRTRQRIEVHLYGALRRYADHQTVNSDSVVLVDVQTRDTVRDALKRLGIGDGEASNVFLNGRLATLEAPLKNGDRIGLFPPNMSILYC